MPTRHLIGSFRDPAGHLFFDEHILYRAVMPVGRPGYERLRSSGLYDELTRDGLLISHEEISSAKVPVSGAWRILRPRRVPFVSYPHEWPFSALKDAALLTLDLQQRALARGLWLKDASAFNVQFLDGRPIFIDTLSFEARRPGPWPAYHQFCRHFLAPLLLMARTDVRLGQLFQIHPDGVPLPLASRLLPATTWLRTSALLHVHLHGWAVRRGQFRRARAPLRSRHVCLDALVDSLTSAVSSVRWSPRGEWTAYAAVQPSYSNAQLTSKIATVSRWLGERSPAVVWDLGTNTGCFSRLAIARGAHTLALDQDPGCVELLYQAMRREHLPHLLPLVIDLTRPTPAIGWANEERQTLHERGTADLLLALALVHHLAIGGNVPLSRIASYLARLGRELIIEFVPKTDLMVQRMLAGRDDVFDDYGIGGFETAFAAEFTINGKERVDDSGRMLYLMTRK